MKKTDLSVLLAFTAAAAGLRAWQDRTGFELSGLPVRGSLPGMLLLVVFAAAAVYFCLRARRLPARVTGAMAEKFPFRGAGATACAVSGVFLLLGSAFETFRGDGVLNLVPLAPLTAVCALCYLYVVFALRRGAAVQGLALVGPVCALVAYLILLYRAEASNPFLARIGVELLAAAAITFCAVQISAFAFSDGTPRVFTAVSALAVLTSVPAAVDQLIFCGRQGIAGALLFAGGALLAAGFLAAADWTKAEDGYVQ